jgi:hypothetical protein
MVSEISVHGHLVCWFGGCDEAQHHGWELVVEQSFSTHAIRKQNKRGTRDKSHTLQKWHHTMTYFLQPGLSPTIYTTSP